MPSLMRLLTRQSTVKLLDALASRVTSLEEEHRAMSEQLDVLWSRAPTWITQPIPHARAHGWTVRAAPDAVLFEHVERNDECRIRLPLPLDPREHIKLQRDLYMRLVYDGPTGLEGLQEPSTYRPRIVDTPDPSDYLEPVNAVDGRGSPRRNGRPRQYR